MSFLVFSFTLLLIITPFYKAIHRCALLQGCSPLHFVVWSTCHHTLFLPFVSCCFAFLFYFTACTLLIALLFAIVPCYLFCCLRLAPYSCALLLCLVVCTSLLAIVPCYFALFLAPCCLPSRLVAHWPCCSLHLAIHHDTLLPSTPCYSLSRLATHYRTLLLVAPWCSTSFLGTSCHSPHCCFIALLLAFMPCCTTFYFN